jgi:hypothetical protein
MAAIVLMTATSLMASAQTELREFPEFRYTSGLPGGGWGVTRDGIPGFDGALQLNVPVAYTPHRGAIVGFSTGSLDRSLPVDVSGHEVNGTGYIALGMGKSGQGLYVCEMPTSESWEPVQNLQQQFMAEGAQQPAVAFGMQDIFENRDRYVGAPNALHDTDSPYVVATRQFGTERQPVYVTFGWGWGRFNSTFIGGVSWRAAEKLTIFGEYDGFNPNAGFAVDLSEWLVDDTILYFGLIDVLGTNDEGETKTPRPVIGLTYVYENLPL